MKKISIIVPVYKVERYIEACLYSVIKQTYTDGLECIIVDDCTPDKSMAVVDKVLNSYDGKIEFKIIHHFYNQGLSAARNTGVRHSTGEFLYFLDSDDELRNNALENLVRLLVIYPKCDFVIGNIEVQGANTKYPLTVSEVINGSQIFSDYIAKKWYVMAWNKLVRKSFFMENNLWFVEGIFHEDTVFSFHLAYYAKQMVCCQEMTYIYKIRSNGSITSHFSVRNCQDTLKGLEANLQIVDINKVGDLLILTYIVNTVYNLMRLTLLSKDMETDEKMKLLPELRRHLPNRKYDRRHFDLGLRIKVGMVNCPVLISYFLFRLHPLFKRIASLF